MKDYKRLTERNKNGEAIINMQGVTNEQEARERIHKFSKLIIDKLCVYEEKEESGELCDREEVRKKTTREILLLLGKGFDENTGKNFKDLPWYESFCRELKFRYGVELEDEE